MTFWEWFLLLCTAPLWAPFALFGIVLALEMIAFGCIVVFAVVVGIAEAFRR